MMPSRQVSVLLLVAIVHVGAVAPALAGVGTIISLNQAGTHGVIREDGTGEEFQFEIAQDGISDAPGLGESVLFSSSGRHAVDVVLNTSDSRTDAEIVSTLLAILADGGPDDTLAASARGFDPDRDVDKPFLMPIEDVFTITGRGTVVTGRIERGTAVSGDHVEIFEMDGTVRNPSMDALVKIDENGSPLPGVGQAGDNVGALLRGVTKDEVERGQVLVKPGSITPHSSFKAETTILTKEEGGRHTPFFSNYRPQFYFRTTDVTSTVMLPDGAKMAMPGDHVEMTIELTTPTVLDLGLRFAIREGGKTVGIGTIVEIME